MPVVRHRHGERRRFVTLPPVRVLLLRGRGRVMAALETCNVDGCDSERVNLTDYCRPHLTQLRAEHLAELKARHEHDKRCCREHGTHSSPHVGCILR